MPTNAADVSSRARRLCLAMLAITGDAALTATLVFPVAATIIVGVAFVPQLLWPGIAGIAFFAWLARPSSRFHGRALEEQAPQLERDIEALKKTLRVPGRMRVYLDESFNAAAMQTRGFLGLAGTRCGLILGVPLLMALGREQVLAIVAHEFGHFSRRHGLLGQWLYRARVGWLEYARQVGESDSVFDRAAAWYAQKFVPFFSALTFAESRQCEYEADADAALAVGGGPFAEALTRAVVMGRYWDAELPRQLAAWQLESPDPPQDFLQRFARRIRQSDAVELASLLDEQMRTPSSAHDTHPGLSQRLQAIQQRPRLASPLDVAGEALLGAAWAKVVAEFNSRWAREHAPGWLAQHLRLKHLVKPLLDADERTARTWGIDLRLARALALRRVDAAAGLRDLRELHELDPAHKRIRFAYASALLAADEESGVERMEALAREHPAFRVAAFERVVEHFERKGDTRQVERWSAWHAGASRSLEEAKSAVVAKADRGELRASTLGARERAVIADAARLDPCVVCAWMLEGSAAFRYSPEREPLAVATHVLALAVDPDECRNRSQDEEAIAARYAELLRTLLPPDEACAVRTFFTTEGRPAVYKPNCDLALYATDDARLSLAEGLGKNDWR